MINGHKPSFILNTLALTLALTSHTVYAASDKKDTSTSQHTIIGGFKSMSGMDSASIPASTDSIAFQPPVVEPPVPIDDIAIIEPVKPPTAADGFYIPEKTDIPLNWMAAYIDTQLQDQVVGYAYAINKDGKIAASNAAGLARTADDDQMDMSIHTRSFVASVTKQITAITAIKILHQAGLSADTPIASYLPDEWIKGDGFTDNAQGITFAHLMTHKTGLGQAFDKMKADDDQTALDSWGNDWDGLEFVVSNGASPGAGSSYKNANYALLRILIPRVWVQMGGAPYNEVTAGNHSSMYLAYLYENILYPAGLYNVACWVQPAQQEALAYSKDFVEQGGVAHETNFNSCGGHSGLRLSAYELAKYLAYLRHSNDIISYKQLGLVNKESFGWDSQGTDGIHWKGGYNFSTFTMNATNNIGGQVFVMQNTVEFRKSSRACIMMFPNGYEASIVVNSEYKTGFNSSPCSVLKSAYLFAADL